jgi:DNA polymerase epsilon subunit 1
MEWQWKGEYYPLNRGEFERIKLHHHTDPNMSKADDMLLLRKEVREYSQKHYKQAFEHKNEMRSDIVCMRENPFYVNTVKAFRDRRYEFKAKVKVWNKAYQKFKDDPDESKKAWNMMLLYESLQLAHKIILNSFYGYVMRRGARWYSMEMAAMVTHTGSEIIQMARNLFVKIGKPLELDTDGIWTLLPAGFPETFDIEFKDGSKSTLSFPCSMCNLLIYDAYKNTQYQMERPDKHMKFTTSTEMSIFFEIDGPHRAMVIPAAREENKVLKKRYAVFDMKGKLSEVKGFEIKRRGELKIIKIFQSEIFQQYLKGTTLRECYQYCAETCNKWLSILRQQGESMREDEIVTLIAESKVLSKNIKEYDSKKGVAITAAKRMSELLGSDLLNGKGLNCKFLISKKPANAPLNERVIPVALLHVKDEPIKMKFLRKWLKDPTIQSADIRPIIDWDYYIERVSNTIQKMVTISAAYQGIENPVPFIAHPKWLVQKLIRESDTNPQQKLLSFFSVKPKVTDIEDMLSVPGKENRQRPSNGMDIERNGSAKKGKLSQKKGFEEFEPTIQYQDNFSGWLEEQKKLWKLNRARRKAGLSSSSGLTRDNAAKSFFKNSELQLQNMPLHILSISKTKTPGEYIMWILFEHSPVSLKVKVERTIYIHVVNPKIDVPSEFKKSAKVLPRDKKVNALYEFTLPEAAFEQSKGTFENYLTNFEYEGIYETQVDLQFKMILKAGSYTKLGINARKDDQGFYGLKDFVYFGSTTADVINKNKLTFVYLFVVPFNENRLLVIVNEKINKVTLVYLHQNRVDESSIPKKAILNSLAKTGRKDEYTLEIINESNRKESMLQCLNKIIKGVEDSISKNFVYCGYGRDHLRDFFSHLEDTRPVIYLKTPDYSKYLQESSSINWYLKAVEHAGTVILEMDSLLDERLTISRQLNIPAGNLPEAWETLATDVLYGRLLNKHNMVHWCSHRHYPDTGMGDVVKEPLLNLIETQLNYEDKTKLAYTTNYAIELSIDNFELAAIMKYEDIIKSDRELSIMVELG